MRGRALGRSPRAVVGAALEVPFGDDDEQSAAQAFFDRVLATESHPGRRPPVCLVTHILPDRPPFLRALSTIADIVAIIPKPGSVDPQTLRWLGRNDFPVVHATRDQLRSTSFGAISRAAGPRPDELLVLDMGGYFAPAARRTTGSPELPVRGVVEDTENGFQRYLRIADELTCPVFSVARSQLKDSEDYLVGQSVMFSVERLLRSCGRIMQGRQAVVFGYGKVGRSIAAVLQSKNVDTLVVDRDPVRAIEAMSRGFKTVDKRAALEQGEVLLCATGQLSLRVDDFRYIRDGAFIASVTSRDDEIELAAGSDGGRVQVDFESYHCRQVSPHVMGYEGPSKIFYLLHDGNAINFLDNAVVGPFIYLVQAELLAGVQTLNSRCHEPGLYEIPYARRAQIASEWLVTYGSH